MKTEFVDVNETRKNLRVEIPSDVVDAEIDRVARDYSRKARIPGFRPGKAPARVIKQRFKDQILHDVAHDLMPRAVDDALRERGVEPVDTPDIRDVDVEEGQPLTFTASFDTVPPFEPGDYATLALRRPSSRGRRRRRSTQALAAAARARRALRAGRRPRRRSTATRSTVDLERDATPRRRAPDTAHQDVSDRARARRRTRRASTSSCSASSRARPRRSRSTTRPTTPSRSWRTPTSSYTVTVKGIKRRVLPELDDEFAKDLGEFETLDALRARVREDLEHEARHAAEREVRARADEAARRAGAVRGAGVARRARDRPAPRGVRAAADGAADRSAAGGHRLERVPREPARRRRARRWPARWCSTRWRGASSSR